MDINKYKDLPEVNLSPNVKKKLLAYFDGENGYTLNLMSATAGPGAPAHSHPHLQIVYVVSGEGEFNTGDENRVIGTGDVVEIPGNVPHTFNSFSKDTVWLEFFTPARRDYAPQKD